MSTKEETEAAPLHLPQEATGQAHGPFSALAELAARLCAAPIALVAAIEDQGYALKSAFGASLPAALCADLLEAPQRGVLEVRDTELDAHWRDHPLVQGAPHMHFFAGVALRDNAGQRLGSLCVIDRVARTLDTAQRLALEQLAAAATRLLEDAVARALEQREFAAVHERLAQTQELLFQERERLAVTLQSVSDGVITTDATGRVTNMNPLAEALSGWTNAESVGRALSEVFYLADAQTKLRAPDPMMVALATNSASGLTLDTVLVRPDGAELPIENAAAPVRDRSGNVIGGVLVARDTSAAQAVAVKMTHLAQHDLLTHLPNRLLLGDRLAQAIGRATRNGTRVALMFLDLDRFKHVNDALGHAIGDKLLQNVAQRLLGSVRASDTVCRSGGDEFAVLLPEIQDGAQAARVAEKLLSATGQAYVIEAHELHVSLSIGISIYPDDAKDAEAMGKNADNAMYHAKERGRNNYQFFTNEMNTRAQQRATLERSLHRGLRRGEFVLHYQPKVCLRTGEVMGAEALLRWQHPELGLVAPDRFIGVAEDTGMIVPLGQWVMRAVCDQLGAWRAAGAAPMPIAINVSAAQVRDKSFIDDLRRACSFAGVEPALLELELTESVLMHDVPATAELLRALKAMGVRLSIDDFGTGYSSLSYLRRFPIDALKIDRSFVRDISSDPDDAAIVSAIISMAKSLKQQVVAEGVETQAQVDFLRARQCDQMQGYLFSRPVTAQALATKFFTV